MPQTSQDPHLHPRCLHLCWCAIGQLHLSERVGEGGYPILFLFILRYSNFLLFLLIFLPCIPCFPLLLIFSSSPSLFLFLLPSPTLPLSSLPHSSPPPLLYFPLMHILSYPTSHLLLILTFHHSSYFSPFLYPFFFPLFLTLLLLPHMHTLFYSISHLLLIPLLSLIPPIPPSSSTPISSHHTLPLHLTLTYLSTRFRHEPGRLTSHTEP